MPANSTEPKIKTLLNAFVALDNLQETWNFMRDLMTEKEIEELSDRLLVANLLRQKVSYSQIEKQTGMSPTTIARISKWLNNGQGGYQSVLGKVNLIKEIENANKEKLVANHHDTSKYRHRE